MIELSGWVSSELMPHVVTVFSAFSTEPPTPSIAPMPASANVPDTSWWWEFSTGPALGGVLALAAAVLAFIRLGHQVAETRRGNTETARKNSEEQWWDTLKWTYTEAKDSQSNAGPFQAVAAVRILDSLNQEHDRLSPQQQRAVESILDIFGESAEPEVQEAVAPLYESFGRISPGTAKITTSTSEYLDELHGILNSLGLGMEIQREEDQPYDLLLKYRDRYVVVIAKVAAMSGSVMPLVAELGDAIQSSPSPDETSALIISMAPLRPNFRKSLDGAGIAVVPWIQGFPVDDLEQILKDSLKIQ